MESRAKDEDPNIQVAINIGCLVSAVLCPSCVLWLSKEDLDSFFKKILAGLTFYTAQGDTITVKSSGDITAKKADGSVIPSITTAQSERRRRLGFFSAPMTSGSFTMIQAGSF